MAFQIEASYFGGYSECPPECVPPPLLSVIGKLPIFAPSSLAHVAQRASEKESGVKAKWCFTTSGYFSLFLCFAL